jgi:hypothetical protein
MKNGDLRDLGLHIVLLVLVFAAWFPEEKRVGAFGWFA